VTTELIRRVSPPNLSSPQVPNPTARNNELAQIDVCLSRCTTVLHTKHDRLSYTVGTAEPEYGPGAIHPVTAQAQPYSVLTKDDLKWKAMQSTNVETQIFYLITPKGEIASIQIIYNNVACVP
jgi:hypothetical protein